MFTANVFDAKVINAECEGYLAKIVLPWAGCDGVLTITMLVQAFLRSSCARIPA